MYTKDETKIRLKSLHLIMKCCTCSLFMNPNTPAAISAPKIIRRQAKNCREGAYYYFSLFPSSYWYENCLWHLFKSTVSHLVQYHLSLKSRAFWPTEVRRHWDSRTAPKQPKKPTIIINPPAPRRMYTAEERRGGQVSILHRVTIHQKTNNTVYNTGIYSPK